jgi:hypothetical protein
LWCDRIQSVAISKCRLQLHVYCRGLYVCETRSDHVYMQLSCCLPEKIFLCLSKILAHTPPWYWADLMQSPDLLAARKLLVLEMALGCSPPPPSLPPSSSFASPRLRRHDGTQAKLSPLS